VAKHFVDDGASVVIEKISGDHALYLVTYGFGVRPSGITK
jgi:hypothetical protein